MITFFNRKGKLYLQFEADGKRYQRSTRLDDTPQNRKLVKSEVFPQLQRKILSGEFSIQKNKIELFKYYAILYLKQKDGLKTYNQLSTIVYNQILPIFGNIQIDKIKRSQILQFKEEKLQKITPKRLRSILGTMSAIFDIALDYEHILLNPAKNIKLPKHIKVTEEPFSQDEIKELLNCADGWFKNYLAFAFYTGARTGELIALQWSDINLNDMYISISKSKRQGVLSTPKTESGIRKVPIFNMLVSYIKMQMSSSKSVFVFSHDDGSQLFGSKNLTPLWDKTLNKANIEKRRLYNTRHTFITNMLKNSNLSILDIAQIVGHKNTEMIIKNYVNFIKGEQLKISRNLDPFTDNTADNISQSL